MSKPNFNLLLKFTDGGFNVFGNDEVQELKNSDMTDVSEDMVVSVIVGEGIIWKGTVVDYDGMYVYMK
jgi:hypothetical protein